MNIFTTNMESLELIGMMPFLLFMSQFMISRAIFSLGSKILMVTKASR
jgi:hypothetical protein